jgi:hypothetical protein
VIVVVVVVVIVVAVAAIAATYLLSQLIKNTDFSVI